MVPPKELRSAAATLETSMLEELAKEENPDSAESKEKRLHMSFAEFIEDFGKRMQAELEERGK